MPISGLRARAKKYFLNMKNKILGFLLMSVLGPAFAAPSDVLRDRANFSNAPLFEDERVFLDAALNAEVVKNYEANPDGYGDGELLPVAVCYMSLKNPAKASELLGKFCAARPENTKAIRIRATILLLTGKPDEALALFKKAYDLGDKESAKLISSAYIFLRKPEKIAEYLDDLREFAKTDLASLNMILFYAYRDPEQKDLKLAREAISKIDVEKALAGASAETVAQTFNLYFENKSDWKGDLLAIPAKGAALGGYWTVARKLYGEVVENNPSNARALLGLSVVEFKLGGVYEAQSLIDKAMKIDRIGAVNSAMEFAVASRIESVFEHYKADFEGFDFRAPIRISMLLHSEKNGANPEIFFMAFNGGENLDIFLEDSRIREYALKSLRKHSADPRAGRVEKILEAKSK